MTGYGRCRPSCGHSEASYYRAMSWRSILFSILAVVAVVVLFRYGLRLLQSSPLLWLIAVSVAAPWIVWHGAHQLYVAAIHGYVLTGVPERRVYRDENPGLYRNNVIAWIVLFPVLSAGAALILIGALEGQHLLD